MQTRRGAQAGHQDSRARGLALALIALAATLIAPGKALGAPAAPYFLIATRDLPDPIFAETVILTLPVTEGGLVEGVIINKPAKIRVQDLIPGAPVLAKPGQTAFFGGPVDVNTPSLLVRATRPLAKAIHVFGDVYLVTDPALINGYVRAPPEANGVRLIVGRAQWTPDQLQAELAEGVWYNAPAEVDTVFSSNPGKVWGVLVKRGQVQEADAGNDLVSRENFAISFCDSRLPDFRTKVCVGRDPTLLYAWEAPRTAANDGDRLAPLECFKRRLQVYFESRSEEAQLGPSIGEPPLPVRCRNLRRTSCSADCLPGDRSRAFYGIGWRSFARRSERIGKSSLYVFLYSVTKAPAS